MRREMTWKPLLLLSALALGAGCTDDPGTVPTQTATELPLGSPTQGPGETLAPTSPVATQAPTSPAVTDGPTGSESPSATPGGGSSPTSPPSSTQGEATTPPEGSAGTGSPTPGGTSPSPTSPGDDQDGDGHSSLESGGDDCDDANPAVYPGNTEEEDGLDNDCNGVIDDLPEPDLDQDGYTASEGDCDDEVATINPGALETPYDGIDQDCDGADLSDVDEDGYPGGAEGTDCDDSNPARNPGQVEIPYDGVDQDCSGSDLVDADQDGFDGVEAAGTDCDDTDEGVNPGAEEIPYDNIDQDCSGEDVTDVDEDGFLGVEAGGDDCDDANANTYPGATEFADGQDNNCDGEIDNDLDTSDDDGDTFAETDGDCNDANAGIFPGANDVPYDGVDQDCDGTDLTDVDGDTYAGGGGPDCNDDAPDTFPGAEDTPYDGVDQDCEGGDEDDLDNDGFTAAQAGGTDCNDQDPFIYPGATDTPYDGVDQDCSGEDVVDADGDTYAATGAGGSDCDDANPDVHPGATEMCDGIDDDCDGVADDNAEDAQTFWVDSDDDGFGDPSAPVQACEASGDLVSNDQDCDDGSGSSYPGAAESCDGRDNNCDGAIDDGVLRTFYRDADGDTFGSAAAPTQACSAPSGYVANNTDCNDTNAAVYPGATETCNGLDDDCDAQTDEGVKSTFYADLDSDGYGNTSSTTQACSAPAGYSSTPGDCRDTNDSVYPGAPESCNGLDDDCDGAVDDNVQTTWYLDADGDTYGNAASTAQTCTRPNGYVGNSSDCNDSNGAIYPGATETCNAVDDDCDAQIDEGVKPTWYKDQDGDSYGDPAVSQQACSQPTGYVANNTDCRDTSDLVYPGATEACNNIDDDCDGAVDDGAKLTWYRDADGDGYGNGGVTTQACTAPTGYVGNGLDCNDGNAAVKPGAVETCNSIDDDCDTQTDEGLQQTWYRDADGDTYGNPANSTQACSQPSGYVPNSTDCNDNNAAVKPGATEACNGVDDDCDAQIDEGVKTTYYQDADGDTYGNPNVSLSACSQPSGYVTNNTDCKDTNDTIYPGATEISNGVDDDCNGQIDDVTYQPSCKDLKARVPSSTSGVYTIDPDGPGGSGAPFQVYCDMTTNGGGWTLVMKVNGSLSTFTYDSNYWVNTTLYQTSAPDLDTTEAKLQSFNSVGFSSVMVGMLDSGNRRYVVMGLSDTSMYALMNRGNQATSLGRDTWKSLMASGSLQPYCNKEGINVVCGGDTKIRIGITSNQENDCGSCDSRIGIGGYGAYCGQDATNTAGNTATCGPDNGDRNTKGFGYVFVR